MKLVSIGVPVRNGAPWLRFALESLLTQDYPNTEIIISDNASEDETENICRSFEKEGRIQYSRNDVNIGPTKNFLRVLSQAHGQLFMWGAHDDLWETAFVSTLARHFDNQPQLVFAMSHYDRFSYVTSERNTRPAEGYPLIRAENSVYENCRAYLHTGSSELFYGLYRTETLRATRFVQLDKFDWSDVCLLNEILSSGRAHIEPRVLFHTGFVAPRVLRSFSATRLPGFTLAYSDYYIHSAASFLRSRFLSPIQKADVLLRLTLQLCRMVYTYEVSRRLARFPQPARPTDSPKTLL